MSEFVSTSAGTEQKKSFKQSVLHAFRPNDGSGEIKTKEILFFSISGFGQNIICTLLSSFILMFFTDALMIAPITVAWIMLGTRLFDAFNDPIMGTIVDRTRSRWGKLRPYMLFLPIPIAILTVLCFTNFGITDATAKIAVATTIYVIWSVLYTIMDVPYWSLSSAMTMDSKKRETLLTLSRLFCAAGAGLIQLLVPIFTGMTTDGVHRAHAVANNFADNADGLTAFRVWLSDGAQAGLQKEIANELAPKLSNTYFLVTLIAVIPALILLFFAFFGTKERAVNATKPQSLVHNLKQLGKNKPILIMMLVGVIGSLRMLYVTMMIYFCKYNLADVTILGGIQGEAIASIFSLLIVPGGLIGSILTPILSRKIGKKWVFILSHGIFGAVATLMTFVDGWSSGWKITLLAIGFVMTGFPVGFSNVLTYAMIGDTVDHLDLKTGERSEGICFATQTFISKMGFAMTAFVGILVLGISGYSANQPQTDPQVYKNIFYCMTLFTGLSTLLCVLPLFVYKFNEREQKLASELITKRNELRKTTGFFERGASFDDDFKIDLLKNTVTYPKFTGGEIKKMTRDEIAAFDFALPNGFAYPTASVDGD